MRYDAQVFSAQIARPVEAPKREGERSHGKSKARNPHKGVLMEREEGRTLHRAKYGPIWEGGLKRLETSIVASQGKGGAHSTSFP